MGSSTSLSAVKLVDDLMPPINGLFPKQAVLSDNAVYDYIVVGGGTAGSVVATRLVENDQSVLMLEAGDNPPLAAILPALFVLLPGSYVDYNYTSTYDPYAAMGQGNYTTLTAGKTLGGSDSLNHYLHFRGSPDDYDEWAKITNDTSWRYENILKYFIKSEHVDDKEILKVYPEYHGTNGPMGLTRELHSDLNDYFKSFAEVGNPEVLELSANVSVGYAQTLYMIDNGTRQTPAITYIKDVKDFPNLHYSKLTRVTKILFDKNVAIGVEAVNNGNTYSFYAKKEVILAAGAFNTPQLLMLSGIGHKEHLESLKINVRADLPVGDNLIDNVLVHLIYKTTKHFIPYPSPEILKIANPTAIPFGVMTGSVALNKSKTTDPDYQTYCLLLPHDTPYLTLICSPLLRLRSEICDQFQSEVASRDAFYCLLVNVRPNSRGTVRLRDTNPFADPIITTGYFTDPQDLENVKDYVKDFIEVGDTEFFQKNDAELVGLDIPKCDYEIGSDEFWECYILRMSGSAYHYAGTCPMGTVVDGELKLMGFDKIRIVDASMIPTVVKSAPNAAVVMVAEKAAAMIIDDDNNNNK